MEMLKIFISTIDTFSEELYCLLFAGKGNFRRLGNCGEVMILMLNWWERGFLSIFSPYHQLLTSKSTTPRTLLSGYGIRGALVASTYTVSYAIVTFWLQNAHSFNATPYNHRYILARIVFNQDNQIHLQVTVSSSHVPSDLPTFRRLTSLSQNIWTDLYE